MKILNREKTHFMQPGQDGARRVKFGKVSEVQALIDHILDGEHAQQTHDDLPKIKAKPIKK